IPLPMRKVDLPGRQAKRLPVLVLGLENRFVLRVRALVAGHVRVIVGLAELRMADGAVVTLPMVLEEQLPVCLNRKALDMADLGAVQAVRPELRRDCPTGWLEVRWLLGQADKDQARSHAHLDLVEWVRRLVEVVPHPPSTGQPTSPVVGPLVVGADEL